MLKIDKHRKAKSLFKCHYGRDLERVGCSEKIFKMNFNVSTLKILTMPHFWDEKI